MDLLCFFFCFVFAMPLCASIYVLLGKGCRLGSRLWCLTVRLSLSLWYPGSAVVLACIDS